MCSEAASCTPSSLAGPSIFPNTTLDTCLILTNYISTRLHPLLRHSLYRTPFITLHLHSAENKTSIHFSTLLLQHCLPLHSTAWPVAVWPQHHRKPAQSRVVAHPYTKSSKKQNMHNIPHLKKNGYIHIHIHIQAIMTCPWLRVLPVATVFAAPCASFRPGAQWQAASPESTLAVAWISAVGLLLIKQYLLQYTAALPLLYSLALLRHLPEHPASPEAHSGTTIQQNNQVNSSTS